MCFFSHWHVIFKGLRKQGHTPGSIRTVTAALIHGEGTG